MTKQLRWVPIYIVSSLLGLGSAFLITSSFMGRAMSQENEVNAPPPSDGSLPQEFLQEIEGGQTPIPPPPLEDLSQTNEPAQPNMQSQDPNRLQAPLQMQQSNPGVSVDNQSTLNQPNNTLPPGLMGGDTYIYDPTGRRDPFKPYRIIRVQPAEGGAAQVLEPLQNYELEQLTIMGILWDVRTPRALVKDSDGKLHTVVKNTKIGRNNGYIALIREGEVIVIETIEEDGKSFKRTQILEFKK